MPLVLLLVVMAAIALMPLSLLLRYRRGTARRLARGWVATLNVVSLALSAGLLLTTAAVSSFWVPRALGYTAAGLATGGLLGMLGVALTRWEPTPGRLYYTPSRGLVLAITLVVTGRLLYGFWRAWHAWHVVAGDESWLARAGAAGSMAAGALVLGYYTAYWAGVRRRVRRRAQESLSR
jgi:hypothetical protein